MNRGELKQSRLRNWLALLLMATAAMAAARTQAMPGNAYQDHALQKHVAAHVN